MKVKLIIGGIVFLFLVGVWLLFSPSRKIEVAPLIVVVGKGQTMTLKATLTTKGWFGGYYPSSGTLSLDPDKFVRVSPKEERTIGEKTTASFSVTGVSMGTGKIVLRGSSNGGAHEIVEITAIVTRGT